MDNLSIVVTALVAGAAVQEDPQAGPIVREAYAGLKRQVEAGYPPVAPSLSRLEAAPGSAARRAVLQEDLAKTAVQDDADLARQALDFLKLVRSSAPTTAASIGVNLDHVIAAGDIHIHDIHVTTVYQLPEATAAPYQPPPAPGVEDPPPEPGSWLPWPRNDLQALARPAAGADRRKGPWSRASQCATTANNLGGVLHALGDYEGARNAYQRALTILEQYLPPDHPHIRTVQRHLESLAD